MKFNHNKKRNTAFLYEILIKELTKATIKKNIQRKTKIMKIIESFFSKGMLLKKELEIYKSFEGLSEIKKPIIEKIIIESKKQYNNLNRKIIFDTQTELIQDINKNLGKNVWDTFVPEYKKVAT